MKFYFIFLVSTLTLCLSLNSKILREEPYHKSPDITYSHQSLRKVVQNRITTYEGSIPALLEKHNILQKGNDYSNLTNIVAIPVLTRNLSCNVKKDVLLNINKEFDKNVEDGFKAIGKIGIFSYDQHHNNLSLKIKDEHLSTNGCSEEDPSDPAVNAAASEKKTKKRINKKN